MSQSHYKVPGFKDINLSTREMAIFSSLNLSHKIALDAQIKTIENLVDIHSTKGADDAVIDQWKAKEFRELLTKKQTAAVATPPSNPPESWWTTFRKTRNLYLFLAWFTSFRLFIIRTNRVLDDFHKGFLNKIPKVNFFGHWVKLTPLFGLSYFLELLIDFTMILKHVFSPDESEKKYPWYVRVKNTFLKDDRMYRMINAAFWFTTNLILVLATGGGSALANVLPFAFDIIHDRWREYREVNEHKAFLIKIEKEKKEIVTDLSANHHSLYKPYEQLLQQKKDAENSLNSTIADIEKKLPMSMRYLQLRKQELTTQFKDMSITEKRAKAPTIRAQIAAIELSLAKETPDSIIQLQKQKEQKETNLSQTTKQLNDFLATTTFPKEFKNLFEQKLALDEMEIETNNKIAAVQKTRRYIVNVGVGIMAGVALIFMPQLLLPVVASTLFASAIQTPNWSKTQKFLLGLTALATIAAFIFPPSLFAITGVSIAGAFVVVLSGSCAGGLGRRLALGVVGETCKKAFNSLGNFISNSFLKLYVKIKGLDKNLVADNSDIELQDPAAASSVVSPQAAQAGQRPLLSPTPPAAPASPIASQAPLKEEASRADSKPIRRVPSKAKLAKEVNRTMRRAASSGSLAVIAPSPLTINTDRRLINAFNDANTLINNKKRRQNTIDKGLVQPETALFQEDSSNSSSLFSRPGSNSGFDDGRQSIHTLQTLAQPQTPPSQRNSVLFFSRNTDYSPIIEATDIPSLFTNPAPIEVCG